MKTDYFAHLYGSNSIQVQREKGNSLPSRRNTLTEKREMRVINIYLVKVTIAVTTNEP